MELPNKPLYEVGDIFISKDDSFLIIKITSYHKGFLEKTYQYETLATKRQYEPSALETPFNEWSETDQWSEVEIYSGIRTKEYQLRKSQEGEEASEAENPNQWQ